MQSAEHNIAGLVKTLVDKPDTAPPKETESPKEEASAVAETSPEEEKQPEAEGVVEKAPETDAKVDNNDASTDEINSEGEAKSGEEEAPKPEA